MTCDWGYCDELAVGWRFWPGAHSRWDDAKPGWCDPPWLPVCAAHLPCEFALAA
jgi:hypothetical protein